MKQEIRFTWELKIIKYLNIPKTNRAFEVK